METKLLDCTLREGTHLNGGQFGKETMANIIECLAQSGTEIVEVGFLNDKTDTLSTSNFNTLQSAEQLLEYCKTGDKTEYALMLRPDRFDVSTLSATPELCTIVRIAFYQKDMAVAIDAGRSLQSHGLDVFLNPIATSTYDDDDLRDLAASANALSPRGVNIVDTFGALSCDRALTVYDVLDNRLNDNIAIGVHLHQNLNLSRAIAQDIIARKPDSRNLIIDGSLYGMGRSPGNLHIELMADYINRTQWGDYRLAPMYNIIDEEIKNMKQQYDWGYSPEYYISAKHNVHRTYAEKMKADNAPLQDIDELCRSVSNSPHGGQYKPELVDEYYDK